MEFELNVLDELIEGLFKMSPEEFRRKCIEDHTKEIGQLLKEYDATAPWRFIKRTLILRRIGYRTREIERCRESLKKRRCRLNEC